MSAEELYVALENAQEALVEWQREWMQLQRGAEIGQERGTMTGRFLARGTSENPIIGIG
ncbi:hypothetical protein MMC07_005398 [Pseudocyphellaria aurata]|nr:hypothetical protein [Pseudocyphellaria aurata]